VVKPNASEARRGLEARTAGRRTKIDQTFQEPASTTVERGPLPSISTVGVVMVTFSGESMLQATSN
jgi:hypothetical protein